MGVDELRTRLSYMSQDSHIFQGTLRENVAYGKPGASDGEIVAALRDAGLGDWLASCPRGWIRRWGTWAPSCLAASASESPWPAA